MFSQWFEMYLNVFYAEYLIHRKTPNSKNLTIIKSKDVSLIMQQALHLFAWKTRSLQFNKMMMTFLHKAFAESTSLF